MPIAYATSAPSVAPTVPNRVTRITFHGWPVSGSIARPSPTRNPANGRTSSDGIGMITLSMATHRATPRYPTDE
jgi:hypothetical protein